MNSVELAEHLGISYRRIDNWTSSGYLRPSDPHPGVGHSRDYPPREVTVADRISGLIEAGLTLQTAAAIARGDHIRLAALLRTLGLSLEVRADAPAAREAAT